MSVANRTILRSPGFTLVETVTAMAISTILLLAMASTIAVAARAVPTGDESVIGEGRIERGLALLRSDLEVATTITWGSTLVLTVPDRDGDKVEETITYDWTEGDRTLMRDRNGLASESLFGPISFGNVVLVEGEDERIRQVLVVFQIAGAQPAARVLSVRTLNRPPK